MTGQETNSRSETDSVLELLGQFFFARTDRVAVLSPKGHPFPVEPVRSLDELLRTHVLGDEAPPAAVCFRGSNGRQSAFRGRFRVGSYSTASDSTVRWLCLDFDGPGHANALADAAGAALATRREFERQGLAAHLERSGGGNGWHLWCFFEEPVPARLARRLAFGLIPDGLMLASGNPASPREGRGIEVFPKQDRVEKGKPGNMVWLPWWCGAAPGGNLFYRVGEGEALDAETPETFVRIPVADAERVVAGFGPEPSRPALRQGPVSGVGSSASSKSQSPWADWRRRALDALPLEAVYGPWLTGVRSNDGWLQCRDPESPTGDQNPSGGVADHASLAERGTFHSFISGASLSVFDFLTKHGGVESFKDAARRVAELSGVSLADLASEEPDSAAALAPSDGIRDSRVPTIQINRRQAKYVIADAWSAIHRWNSQPSVFRRLGHLVQLAHVDEEGLALEPMEETATWGLLLDAANWVRVTPGEEELVDVVPPRDFARLMANRPDERLPSIRNIITTPVFGSTGELIDRRGFHPREKLWYEPPAGFQLPLIPEKPTDEDLAAARSALVEDLLGDFPFVSPSDRAHAVAALLLHFVRPLISGRTPIHLIEAPTAGTGKGLFASVVSILATGQPAAATTLPKAEDEIRKLFTTELLLNRPILFFDNADDEETLRSPAVASITTSVVWRDRLLGQNKSVSLPNLATWILTGNNVSLSRDIARRCVRIRMDAGVERPEDRLPAVFRHPNIEGWATENRPRLVAAVLTLIRAWIVAGQPRFAERSRGSFEEWSQVIGGILEAAGIPGFLENVQSLTATADTRGSEMEEFVVAWWDEFGETPKQAAELYAFCDSRDLMGATRGDGGPRSQQTRLGAAILRARDRIFDGKQIRQVARYGAHRGRSWYALVPAGAGDVVRTIPGIRSDSGQAPRCASEDDRSAPSTSTGPSGPTRSIAGSDGESIDLANFDGW